MPAWLAGTIVVWPDIDGYFLPNSVPNIFAAGKQNDVATISGFTRDESSNDLRTAGNLEAHVAATHRLYGDQAEKYLTLYPASSDAEARQRGSLLRAKAWPSQARETGR